MKNHRRVPSLILVLFLVLSITAGAAEQSLKTVLCSSESAAPLEADESGFFSKAGEIAQSAVSALFGDAEGAVSVGSVFKSIFSGIGYVNSSVAFLKLIGIMKDSTSETLANVMEQLNIIDDRLNEMDAKLDGIISQMSEIKSSVIFNARTDRAVLYRRYFSEFKRDYCVKGLDPLITELEAMRINATKKWYNASEPSRRTGTIDNSYVTLIYDEDGNGGYSLRYTTLNGVPDGYEGRYIILSEKFLPVASDLPQWNVDRYKTAVQDYIRDSILKNFSDITAVNYPDFTPEGVMQGLLSEKKIEQVAEDAANVIIYRVTASEVNSDARYALSVLQAFQDYADELLKTESGFDAVLRALFFTHTFEYEISDLIKELAAELIFETTYYGAFVRDVIGMSDDISTEKREQFDKLYCSTLISLDECEKNSLTGKPRYCYITNTELKYGIFTLTASAQINTTSDGSCDAYVTCYSNPIQIALVSGLVGDDAATLISMTLRSSGITADHSYLAEKLGGGSVDDCKKIVVSLKGEENLPLDSGEALTARNVIGDYFAGNGTVSLKSLPGKAESQYVNYHRMVRGSTMDFASGSLSSGSVLCATAVYGESHWNWWDDETAFISGPNSAHSINRAYSTVCTKDYGKKAYEHYHTLAINYNCLMSLGPALSEDGTDFFNNPLAAFRAESSRLLAEYSADFPSELPENGSPVPGTLSSSPSGVKIIKPAVIVCAVAAPVIIAAAVFIAVRSKKKKTADRARA